jgi:AcrR family transcriptional regulator
MSAKSVPSASRRGRPSLARVNAIDRAVIDTARRLFLSDGFDAVAMEQVAAAAGISKGTLYARHASKEVLFKAVIEATVRDWSEEAAGENHLLTDDIGQRLRHHAHIASTWLRRPDVQAIMRQLQAVQDRFPDLVATMHEAGYLYFVGVIAADIAAAARRDGVPARDPDRVARTLVSAIAGYQVQERMGGELSESDVQAQEAFIVDMLIRSRPAW